MMETVMKRIRQFIARWTKRKRHASVNQQQTQKKSLSASSTHALIDAKMLWDDMYGNMQAKLENSYRVIAILSLTILVAIMGFIIVAGETKVKPIPFVLRGDSLITIANLHASEEFKRLKPTLALYFAQHFIENARRVTTDGNVNQRHHINSLAFVSGEALTTLKNYFNQHNANVIAQQSIVDIEQLNLLHESNHTLVARWVQVWRDPSSGEVQYRKRFIAQMTYHYGKPSSNETIVQINPLGFVITYLSWSIEPSV